MKTLESLFRRFGSPAKEMNESIYIHGTRADCIKDMKHIKNEDERARADDFRNAGIYRNAERVPKNAFRPRTGDLHRIVSFANQNQTEYRLLVQEKILYHYAIENIRRGRAHDPR